MENVNPNIGVPILRDLSEAITLIFTKANYLNGTEPQANYCNFFKLEINKNMCTVLPIVF